MTDEPKPPDSILELYAHMTRLIEENVEGEPTPKDIVTAATIAAEDAVAWGLVDGPLWEWQGAELLAAHYAMTTGRAADLFAWILRRRA
jgi:hypothetical protein